MGACALQSAPDMPHSSPEGRRRRKSTPQRRSQVRPACLAWAARHQPLTVPLPLSLAPTVSQQAQGPAWRKRAKKMEEGEESSPAKRIKSPGNSRGTDRKPGSPSEQLYKQSQITGFLRQGSSQPATASAAAAPAHAAATPAVRSPPRAANAGRSSTATSVAAAPMRSQRSPHREAPSAAHVTDVAGSPSPATVSRTAASAAAPAASPAGAAAAHTLPIAPVAAAAGPSVAALEQARATVEKRLSEEKARREAAERSGSQAQAQLDHLHSRMRSELEELLRASAVEEARARRLRTAEEEQELGRIIYVRRAPHLPPQEMWEDGIAFHEWRKQRDEVQRERERLDKRKKEVTKALRSRTRWRRQQEEAGGERGGATPSSEGSMPPPALPASACDGEDTGDVVGFGPVFQSPAGLRDPSLACAWDDIGESHEWISVQLANLKRRESELEEERRRLDARKSLLIKELRRQADERGASYRHPLANARLFAHTLPARAADSRFSPRPLLADRYLLLKLLGRGGFSEVWHAYDVQDLGHVRRRAAVAAVQGAHIVGRGAHWPAWRRSRARSTSSTRRGRRSARPTTRGTPRASTPFTRCASPQDRRSRSVTAHSIASPSCAQALNHPRIVRLFNVFEIDQDSFATVLEHCRGTDLDHYLKERKQLPEREARALLIQILSALHFLSTEGADAVARSAGNGAGPGMVRVPRFVPVPIAAAALTLCTRPGPCAFSAAEHHPLRPQARQHSVRRAQRGQDHGLWPVQDPRGRRAGQRHRAHLPRSGHVLVPASRVLRGRDHAAQDLIQGGCVVGGRHLLPDAVRPAAVRGGPVPGLHPRGAHHPARHRCDLPGQACGHA